MACTQGNARMQSADLALECCGGRVRGSGCRGGACGQTGAGAEHENVRVLSQCMLGSMQLREGGGAGDSDWGDEQHSWEQGWRMELACTRFGASVLAAPTCTAPLMPSMSWSSRASSARTAASTSKEMCAHASGSQDGDGQEGTACMIDGDMAKRAPRMCSRASSARTAAGTKNDACKLLGWRMMIVQRALHAGLT